MTSTATFKAKSFTTSFAEIFSFPSYGNKAVSTYMEVIKITTDKKSLKASEFILNDLKGIIKNLPTEQKDFKGEELKHCLDTGKKNLLELNKLFDTIDYLFDIPNTKIDDTTMMEFYDNMQKAKSLLLYVIEYITLVFDIQESKKHESVYSLDQFLQLIGVENEIAA